MDNFFIYTAMFMCFLVILALYRGVAGPTVLDRIISISAIGTKTTIILVLMGFIYKRADMFLDIAIAYALLNFIATIAAAKFFRRRKSIIPGEQCSIVKGEE